MVHQQMIGWLTSKWAGAAAVLIAVLSAFGLIRMDAKRDAKRDQQVKDLTNAEDIRRRADTADKRLRDHDDAGWRD